MVILLTSGPRTDVNMVINASQMAKVCIFTRQYKYTKLVNLNKQKKYGKDTETA